MEDKKTPIKLDNTLTNKKQEFKPINEQEVLMYSCGPTVYNYLHIGNLRSYLFSDILKRTLKYNGYKVHQVINITDVGHLTGENEGAADFGEDKIEKGAKRENKSVEDIIKMFTEAFFNNITDLNLDIKDTKFPRATNFLQEQINLIKTLEKKGYTYRTEDGIYFDTSLFSNYGKLGGLDFEKSENYARISKNPQKKNDADFSLWKFSKKEENRMQEWSSPWGVGYPGWHLECSAMAMNILGEEIDIHTGGIDLISVHHNNEIAQSECATGKNFARFWLHGAHLLIDGEKISKSIGNVVLLSDIKEKGYYPLSLRYLFLTLHYKSQASFNWNALGAAQTALFKIYRLFGIEMKEIKSTKPPDSYKEKFLQYINNDLDTPKVIALLWNLIKDENIPLASKKATLIEFDKVLGLNLGEAQNILEKWSKEFNIITLKNTPPYIKEMMKKRESAREKKDWQKADELREKIQKEGFYIEDTDKAPVLRRI